MITTEEILSPDGPLASRLPGYERRDSQIRMALAVEEAALGGGVLLAEAGTGTGKTLAYLIPAILSERTVVVSTGTKNLQEQIFFKEIRFIEDLLKREIGAVYLKGQDNYLCLRRFEDLSRSPRALAHPPARVAELQNWAKKTETGDRMEISGLADDDPLWREVCSTRETRIGARCRHFDDCFVTRARKTAMGARLVVVNHHLYFADLATRMQGGSILPAHDVAIFDEAHLVEDIATEFFSTKVSSGRIARLIDDGLAVLRKENRDDDIGIKRWEALAEKTRSASAGLFDLFRGPQGRARLVPEEIDDTCVFAYHRLDSNVEAMEISLRQIEGRGEVVDHCIDRFAELRGDLARVMEKSARGFVHWVENRQRSIFLGASPIDISETFRQGIFFAVPTVILTSATLSAAEDFSFLRSRLGIDFDAGEISLPSPFDYSEQACLYLPRDIVDPRDDGFAFQVADRASDLIRITGGGALVLCTSVRNMKAVHARLSGRVKGPLHLQGEAPKSLLLSRFNEDKSTVLCATTSFWQGVDLPGDALRLVIIDKLPFASPSDPLVAARIAHIAGKGGNPFAEYQIPAAVLALKQGFGRLIRTTTDRGIVAIMDRRLGTMPYARTFLNALPSCPRLTEINAVERWWARKSREVR